MDILTLAANNLLSPIILSFALGVAAALARSDLSIPPSRGQRHVDLPAVRHRIQRGGERRGSRHRRHAGAEPAGGDYPVLLAAP